MDDFVRRYNSHAYDRFWPPLADLSDPARRGLINEAAFIFFSETFNRSVRNEVIDRASEMTKAFAKSHAYLKMPEIEVRDGELDESLALADRLLTYFYSTRMSGPGAIILSPKFSGCGVVGSCSGDVRKGQVLYEIKAGSRNFRSIDYRQLLVYASLYYSDTGEILEGLAVCNPRTGIVVSVPIQTFAYEVSGLVPLELFERVLAAFSANFVSD